LDHAGERRLAVEREKDRDPARAAEHVETLDARRDRAIGGRALARRHCAPRPADPPPQTAAFGAHTRGGGPPPGRPAPLLSNRSNKWGTSWRLKAFRVNRICTTPPTELTPDA